ncbi:hypothetical protein CN367_11605 [Priestia megaterium]|uniref:hypothetical protein n=1 Tax=Priestia megaterium TaxID=1404 RepID=UPI000BF5555B|nr:hypothetical protein [Priestia megaterium]PEZ47009.1 hypothetical protein CN367_11605 [Priestia megaterium]
MNPFKTGDKVKRTTGGSFSTGDFVLTVSHTHENDVFFTESAGWLGANELKLASPFEDAIKALEKELIVYQEKVKEFANKVDKLEITLETLKTL